MAVPTGALEQLGDTVVGAGAAIVERQQHRRHVARLQVVDDVTPRGHRRDGRDVPRKVSAIQLVTRRGATGEAARLPVAVGDYVMIEERKRSHGAFSALVASSAGTWLTRAGPTCPTPGSTCRSGRPALRPRREASSR